MTYFSKNAEWLTLEYLDEKYKAGFYLEEFENYYCFRKEEL